METIQNRVPGGVQVPVDKRNGLVGDLVSKLKSATSSLLSHGTPLFSKMNRQTKLLLAISAVFFILLFVTAGVASLLLKSGKRGGSAVPIRSTLAPGTKIATEPINPSVYANDAKVFSIEAGLTKIGSEMNEIDLKEAYLSLPRIEFNINFNK